MRRAPVRAATACGSVAIGALVCAGVYGVTSADATGADPAPRVVVETDGGRTLTDVPLTGDEFAVSYRNSIYRTKAEERYEVDDGSYELVEIAADQLAVLEEYYGVSSAPEEADPTDRREWVVPPDEDNAPEFNALSIAATDLGERTLHVPGEDPVQLYRLVEDDSPYIQLRVEDAP